MRLMLLLLLCLFLVQCSNDSTPEKTDHIQLIDEIPEHIQEVENLTIFPGDSEPKYSIELIPEQSFGKTGEPYLTRILGSVVDENGRVIVWNSNTDFEQFIYVYNDDGTYYTQIGSPGRGPGEYGFILDVQAKAGKVFILDATGQRINVYNTTDYSVEKTLMIEQLGIANNENVKSQDFRWFEPRNDGNHFILYDKSDSNSERQQIIKLLMDEDGNALNFEPLVLSSGLNVIKRGSRIPSSLMSLPFMGSTITAGSFDDETYLAWTQDFLIKKYDSNGVYQSSIYYPVTGPSFDLSVYTESISSFNEADVMNTLEIVGEELPESNAVLASLKVDDENRIWAAVPMDTNYEWWILDPSGELLAKLQHPQEKTIFDIKNGYLYAKEIDEETDVEYLVKYRIELEES